MCYFNHSDAFLFVSDVFKVNDPERFQQLMEAVTGPDVNYQTTVDDDGSFLASFNMNGYPDGVKNSYANSIAEKKAAKAELSKEKYQEWLECDYEDSFEPDVPEILFICLADLLPDNETMAIVAGGRDDDGIYTAGILVSNHFVNVVNYDDDILNRELTINSIEEELVPGKSKVRVITLNPREIS